MKVTYSNADLDVFLAGEVELTLRGTEEEVLQAAEDLKLKKVGGNP